MLWYFFPTITGIIRLVLLSASALQHVAYPASSFAFSDFDHCMKGFYVFPYRFLDFTFFCFEALAHRDITTASNPGREKCITYGWLSSEDSFPRQDHRKKELLLQHILCSQERLRNSAHPNKAFFLEFASVCCTKRCSGVCDGISAFTEISCCYCLQDG